MRSKTGSPCRHPAVVRIRDVAFCRDCAREQGAYFAIGEIVARGKMGDLRGGALAEVLGRVRRESAGAKEGAAGRRRGPSGAHESERPALKAGKPREDDPAPTSSYRRDLEWYEPDANGDLGGSRAALEASLTVADADRMLGELAEKGHLEVRAREGKLFYAF